MSDRIISIYNSLEEIPSDFHGQARIENANYIATIDSTGVYRVTHGSSDDIAYRPSAVTIGKGTWTVDNEIFNSVNGNWINTSLAGMSKQEIDVQIQKEFLNHTNGAWYDPSDYSTMFQDLLGATPVTAVGQPVRLMMDKSQFGNAITFSGTNPPLTAVDANGVKILSPVDVTSRGVCAGLVLSLPITTISVQNFTRTGEQVLYDSYVNNGGCRLMQTTIDHGVAVGNSVTPIIRLGNEGLSTYRVNHVTNNSSLYLDGQFVASGAAGNNGLNGLSLFSIMGAPNPLSPVYHSTLPFYGLILTAGLIPEAVCYSIEQYFRKRSVMPIVINPKAFAVGDSTIAAYIGFNRVIDYIPTIYEKVSIANPGDTIAQQLTAWQYIRDKRSAKWVIAEIGLNDLDPAVATSTTITALQGLITEIRNNVSATTKILIAQMTPCRARLITLYGAVDGPVAYQKWLDINSAIAGSGATPITGVDGRVTSHVALLNDGSGNLAAAYNSGDNIHTNNVGRKIVAEAWSSSLTALNIL